jgi:hypothetical protein
VNLAYGLGMPNCYILVKGPQAMCMLIQIMLQL